MIAILKRIYQRQTFFPSILGLFVNPFFFARDGLHRGIRELSPYLSGRLLDVGCGTKPYQQLFDVEQYLGLDIDSVPTRKSGVADYLYDGHKFPLQNGEFDAVLCNQVLEHVFNPNDFLLEIHRVLTPGGKLLLTVPFVWDEHEQPFDYARYSSYGLMSLLKKGGFNIIEHRKLGADVTVIFQLFNAYLYKIIQPLPRVIRGLLTVTVIAAVNVLGLVLRFLLPANPDLFLDQIVLAEKAK